MLKGKLAILSVVVMIGAAVLGACGPLPEGVIIEETSVVVEEVTAAADAEVVASATPEPEPPGTQPAQTPESELEGLWYPVDTEPPTLDPRLQPMTCRRG